MKNKILKTFFFTFVLTLGLLEFNTLYPDKYKDGYRYLTIDRFSKEGNWKIRFSKYRSKYWDTDFFSEKEIKKIPNEKWIKWIKSSKEKGYDNKYILPPTTYNKEIFDNTNDGSIISIRGEWDKADLNWIFIYPSDSRMSDEYYTGIKDMITMRYFKNIYYKNQNYIIMPSKIVELKVFVWSIGYPYKLEAHFDDYLGNNYIVSGNRNLDFLGWKEISFNIPNYILQNADSIPVVRPLKFLGFKILSSFKDPYKGFYTYIDHIRAKTVINNNEFLGHYLKRDDIYWDREKALEEMKKSNDKDIKS